MDETQKPPEPQEEAKPESVDYTGARKPWVTVLLVSTIVVLYFDGKEKDKEIARLNHESKQELRDVIKYAAQNSTNATQVARLTKELLGNTNKHDTDKNSNANGANRAADGAE